MLPLFQSSSRYNQPPAADEIEATIIGPGFGEAAVVHVGDGRWFLVDSCVGSDDPTPAALRYLADIGVSPDQVFLILVSHWDDDHCRGIASLVRACAKSRVAMSKAFVKKDFLAYVEAHQKPMTRKARAGAKEIRLLMQELQTSKRTAILGATADRRIFGPTDLAMSHGAPVEIWTFAPSDTEHDNFLLWAANSMPNVGETRRAAVRRIRNDLSVVVYVSVGGDAVLFGGDLEEEGNPLCGWSAVLTSPGRPSQKASLYKVSHHGSETGHHPQIWKELLHPEPTAVVAPFRNGNVSLPKAGDVQRILGNTSTAYSSTTLQSLSPPSMDRSVQKTMEEVAKKFTTIKPEMGIVRSRKCVGETGPWNVELYGAASPLGKAR